MIAAANDLLQIVETAIEAVNVAGDERSSAVRLAKRARACSPMTAFSGFCGDQGIGYGLARN